MHRSFSRIGFTLIELLIVVAIIAILAAIAVPNFLEAQTRSKVSRVLADMRTLKTGLESYRVDSNSYPGSYESLTPIPFLQVSAARVLSTPVAYLTRSLIADPFAPTKSGERVISFAIGNRASNSSATWPKDCYALASWGPDQKDNSDIGQFPFGRASRVTPPEIYGGWQGPYDPTNGTVSEGEIAVGVPRLPYTWVIPGTGDLPLTQDPFAY